MFIDRNQVSVVTMGCLWSAYYRVPGGSPQHKSVMWYQECQDSGNFLLHPTYISGKGSSTSWLCPSGDGINTETWGPKGQGGKRKDGGLKGKDTGNVAWRQSLDVRKEGRKTHFIWALCSNRHLTLRLSTESLCSVLRKLPGDAHFSEKPWKYFW